MKSPKPVKAFKRWARIGPSGYIYVQEHGETRASCLEWIQPHELARVLITPIPPKRKGRRK